MTNKLPNDFIISNEYCVIEPGLTTFNKDQIITHADLMKHLEEHQIQGNRNDQDVLMYYTTTGINFARFMFHPKFFSYFTENRLQLCQTLF